MVAFLADENLHAAIVEALRHRNPDIDVVTVQEAGLRGKHDNFLLAWAANQRRLLVTHDVKTMPAFLKAAVAKGKPVPGVVIIQDKEKVNAIVEDLLTIDFCTEFDEWTGQIIYVPM